MTKRPRGRTRTLATGALLCAALVMAALPAAAVGAGTVDTTFDGDGIVTTDVTARSDGGSDGGLR